MIVIGANRSGKTVCNVNAVLGETHPSKVQFSTFKQIFFETLTSSRNIRYITKIYVMLGTAVSNVLPEKRHTNIVFSFAKYSWI